MVLGAPVGTTTYTQKAVDDIIDRGEATMEQIHDLNPTGLLDTIIPYILHCTCLGHARLNHILRLTPPKQIAPKLRRFDGLT